MSSCRASSETQIALDHGLTLEPLHQAWQFGAHPWLNMAASGNSPSPVAPAPSQVFIAFRDTRPSWRERPGRHERVRRAFAEEIGFNSHRWQQPTRAGSTEWIDSAVLTEEAACGLRHVPCRGNRHDTLTSFLAKSSRASAGTTAVSPRSFDTTSSVSDVSATTPMLATSLATCHHEQDGREGGREGDSTACRLAWFVQKRSCT